MMNNKVSVITLTYKKFDRIYKCINSVLRQDYENIEYIISDDGSPNFPYSEIRNYINGLEAGNNRKIKILRNPTNLGTVQHYNNAIKQSSGNVIMPLSGDDEFYERDVVSKVVSVFEKSGCQALTVSRAVVKNGIIVNYLPGEKAKKRAYEWKTNRDQYEAFISGLSYGCFSGSVLYFTRDCIINNGYFDERYKLWEDGPFFARFLWNNKIEMDFDIIGIKYNLGGISTNNVHPLLLKDVDLYETTDALEHIDSISFLSREALLFSQLRRKAETKKDVLCAYLKHPFGLLRVLKYRYDRGNQLFSGMTVGR